MFYSKMCSTEVGYGQPQQRVCPIGWKGKLQAGR